MHKEFEVNFHFMVVISSSGTFYLILFYCVNTIDFSCLHQDTEGVCVAILWQVMINIKSVLDVETKRPKAIVLKISLALAVMYSLKSRRSSLLLPNIKRRKKSVKQRLRKSRVAP